MSPRTISLSRELDLLARSVRGARVLTQQWAEAPLGIGFEGEDVPHVVFALLVVITSRLELLDRAVRGTIDPRLLWSPPNDAAPSPSHGEDITLKAWNWEERSKRAKDEVRRLKKRSSWSTKGKAENRFPKSHPR